MGTIAEKLDIAVESHRSGELQRAERLYREILRGHPQHADALHGLGLLGYHVGRHQDAVDNINRAIALRPDSAVFHNNLGNAYFALGELDQALASYARAVEIKPGYASAHSNLGNVLRTQGKLQEAVASCKRAIDINPRFAAAHNNLGNALKDLGKLDEAVISFRRALELSPDYVDAHFNLGNSLRDQGNLEGAVNCYERTVQQRPDHAEAHNNLGNAFRDLGKFDQAVASFEQALKFKPNSAKALADLVQTRRGSDADEVLVKKLEELLASQSLSQGEQCHAHFALGDYYDRREQWELAFGHYQRGNSLAETSFDCTQIEEKTNALIETCTRPLLDGGATLGISSELPVLIVGMPRSGTSLVEQILASHPSVFGAGELPYVAECALTLSRAHSTIDYPACLSELDRATASELSRKYLKRLESCQPDAVRVVDKAPGNYMHLGLLALLLPKARIIHCRRHPLDVCLSCYFQNFTDRRGLSFSFDLRGVGQYYREYAKLMEHWRHVLPLPVLEVDYEQLVVEPEKASRQLVEFCRLPWDPACLVFHKTARAVQTASRWQVRQPIYNRSVGRWKYYEPYLGPLKEALEWSEATLP